MNRGTGIDDNDAATEDLATLFGRPGRVVHSLPHSLPHIQGRMQSMK